MKKILCFILLFCGCIKLDIKAHDAVIFEEGVGTNSDLQEENCKIINHNVDFNKQGEYQVYYYNQLENEYFHKTIIVNKRNSFLESQSVVITEGDIVDDEIEGILYVSGNEFYVYGNMDSGDEVIQTNFVQTYAYVSYYKNNEHLWTKVFNDTYSYIKDACLFNKNIILGLAYERGNNDSDIMLLEMNANQEIMFSKTIGWNGIEILKKIFVQDNYLYCLLESDASDVDPFFVETNFFIFIKFDYYRQEIAKIKSFGNNRVNTFCDAIFKDSFYLLVDSKGTKGDIQMDNCYSGSFIIKINKNLELISIYRYEYPLSNALFLDTTKWDFYAFSEYSTLSTYNARSAIFYANNLAPKRGYEYKGDGFLSKIYGDEKEQNIYLVQDRKNNTAWLLNMETQEKTLIGKYSISVMHYVDGVYYFVSEHKKYALYNFDFVERSREIHNHKTYYTGMLLVNDDIMGWLYEKEQEAFGEYQEIVEISNYKLKYILNYEYYIPFECNLKNKEVYDVNTKIFFNGQGYFDGKEVESGTRLLEEGKHELLVIGNNEQKVIYFEIKKMAIEPQEEEKKEIDITNINALVSGKNSEYAQMAEINIVDENDNYGYGIMILISIIIGSLIIPVKKRRKK